MPEMIDDIYQKCVFSKAKKLQIVNIPLETLLFFLLSSSGSFGRGFMSNGLFTSLHTTSNTVIIKYAEFVTDFSLYSRTSANSNNGHGSLL